MKPILTQSELDAMAQQERAAPNPPDNTGHVFQRHSRIPLLVGRCCEEYSGDLIEIGCYLGGTTAVLVEIARRYNRKVICLDNFKAGDSYELDKIGVEFKKRLPGWADVVEFHEIDAHTEEARKLIRSRRYAFAFSDDGHSFDVHVNELETLMPVVDGGIAVDDVYLPDVVRAIDLMLTGPTDWQCLMSPGLAEAWLLRK